jgi:hypothetical protein
MITVACVLSSGGPYDARWVRALYRGVRDHWPANASYLDFVCLSDRRIGMYGIRDIALVGRFPGWWAKLELFRPDVFDRPVLYLDLDTLVVGDLAELIAPRQRLTMLADFYREANRAGRPRFGESGVMGWTPGPETEAIWRAFVADPKGARAAHRGDGSFIRANAGHDYWQDVLPGQIVSYKIHARVGPPEGARLVCGHGRPKFTDANAGWAHTRWLQLAGAAT